MQVVRTRHALRTTLDEYAPTVRIGFVPTMGALHRGHLQLVAQSRSANDVTVVSVFVNPSQFDNADDLARYPRDEARDVAMLADAGVDVMFAPGAEEVYPADHATWVTVTGVTDVLEGVFRPGHFRGVATVVTLLLRMIRPHRAYFGEKDWQQLLVVTQLARDLMLNVEIVGVPTVREADGLAMSSRNARLGESARAKARGINAAIRATQDRYVQGERDALVLESLLHAALAREVELTVEYATVVNAATLRAITHVHEPARVLVAAAIDGVRLIDNGPLG